MTPDTTAHTGEPALGNVTALPRRSEVRDQDRINLALAILGHRPWCTNCLPHARQAAEALTGVSLDELAAQTAQRRAPETEG